MGDVLVPLRKCENHLCDYWLIGSALYCCGGCARAHEGRYEIHESGPLGHSENCAKRVNMEATNG